MKRKEYMRDHYGKFWLNAREKYGFPTFNKSICDYICEHTCKDGSVLDVGIGTGYPHADYLQRAGFEVYGIDISALLITECWKKYPNILARAGDAENLPYPDESFDSVYSISSTKYFPDILKAISEMVRVTKQGGLVIFDLKNAANFYISLEHQKALNKASDLVPFRVFWQVIIGLGVLVLRRRWPQWRPIVIESPTEPKEVYDLLDSLKVTNYQTAVSPDKDHPIEVRQYHSSCTAYRTIVLVVTK